MGCFLLVLPFLGAQPPTTAIRCPGAACMPLRPDVGPRLDTAPAVGQWSGELAIQSSLHRRLTDFSSCFWCDVQFRRAFPVCLGYVGNSWHALVVFPGSVDGRSSPQLVAATFLMRGINWNFALYSPILRPSNYAAKKNCVRSSFSEEATDHPQAHCE